MVDKKNLTDVLVAKENCSLEYRMSIKYLAFLILLLPLIIVNAQKSRICKSSNCHWKNAEKIFVLIFTSSLQRKTGMGPMHSQ